MKLIPLTHQKFAMVDDIDFEELSKYRWAAHRHKNGVWYAERTVSGKVILMHRYILNPPDGMLVDHKDRDGLNNQRTNIRLATRGQNNANRRAAITSQTSKFLGVAFEKDRQKWTARIRKNGIGYRLGSFQSEREAAMAYNSAAVKFHGEFANLNQLT